MASRVISSATSGTPGATGPSGESEMFALDGATDADDTAITVDHTITAPVATSVGYVAIGVGTTTCEIRQVATVSGANVTGMTALGFDHSAGDRVIFFQNEFVPSWWFGAKADNTADDAVALQRAMYQCQKASVWLTGGGTGRVHLTSKPLMMGGSQRLAHLSIATHDNFIPYETNAILQQADAPGTFTADPATNVITSSVTTGAAAKPVMFFGSDLPAPLVEGRAYWPTAVTSTTFTVAEEKGGATVDITDAGSGTHTIYRGLFAGDKAHMHYVILNGTGRGVTIDHTANTLTSTGSHNLVTGQEVYFTGTLPAELDDNTHYFAIVTSSTVFKVAASEADAIAGTPVPIDLSGNGSSVRMWNGLQNGLFLQVQQPSLFINVRVNTCRGIGVLRSGQQAVWHNLEVDSCGIGVMEDISQFVWTYGFDVEGSYKSHLVIATSDDGDLPSPMHNGGSANNNMYVGCHHEKNGPTNDTPLFDFRGDHMNLSFENVRFTAGPNVMFRADPETADKSGFTVRNMTVGAQNVDTTIFEIVGSGGTYTDIAQTNTVFIDEFSSVRRSGLSSYNDQHRNTRIGFNGKRISESLGNNVAPTREFWPASNQTVDQHKWHDRSGNTASGVSKEGRIYTMSNTAPADGDLAANQVMLWFDPTNGAAKIKFKAKQADGTVKSGEVALS